MKETLKNVGLGLIGIAVFIGGALIVGFLIKGGLWVSAKLLPLFSLISSILFIAFCVVLLPMAIFKKTRGYSGVGMVYSSYLFGATLWMWAFLLCFSVWGWKAVIIGLLIAGVGVVPVALLATALHGMWPIFWELLLLIFIVFGSRMLGAYLIGKAEETY